MIEKVDGVGFFLRPMAYTEFVMEALFGGSDEIEGHRD